MQRRLSWALSVGGVLGLVWAVPMIPFAVLWSPPRIAYPHAWVNAAGSLVAPLPKWLQWQGGSSMSSGTGICLLIVAVVCVLLLISGGSAGRVVAVVGLAWFGYVVVTFSPHAYWMLWMENSGDPTPLAIMTLVSFVVVPVVSIFALVTARRLRRERSGSSVAAAVPGEQALQPDAHTPAVDWKS